MSAPSDIVDAQVHLTLEMDEQAILASMDALGIRSAVLDEFWYLTGGSSGMSGAQLPGGGFRPLSPYAQAAALRHPDRLSFLQRVDRRDPEVGSLVKLLGTTPGCRAIRVLLLNREERTAFGEGGYDEILTAAQAQQLPICLLGADIVTLSAVTHRFPTLPIVLDHCGWARSIEHWEQILTCGSIATVYLKWSHPARVFGEAPDPVETSRVQLGRALEAFGVERVMWASDVTEEHSGTSWAELLANVAHDAGLSLGDREWLLSRTARELFRWPASHTNPANTATVS